MTTNTLRMLNGYHLGQTVTIGTGPNALTGDLIRFEHHVEQYAMGADGATSEAVVTFALAGRDPETLPAMMRVEVHGEEEATARARQGRPERIEDVIGEAREFLTVASDRIETLAAKLTIHRMLDAIDGYEDADASIDVDKVMRAVNDPGSFVERNRWKDGITHHEALADWQRRALRVALGTP